MKPQVQILLIALAIVFAVALVLTIALVSVASFRNHSAAETERTEASLADTTAALPVIAETDTETTAVTTEEETTLPPDPPDSSEGLAYLSNGNGTCVLSSVGTCTDACVVIPEYAPSGDRVTAIAARAFYECQTVTAVQIPVSVTFIGDLAFAGCPNLMYLSVSSRNDFYCDRDGVLYTKDGGILILYPALHGGSSLFIGDETAVIKEMAFYDCTYLKTVRYAGSPEQWELMCIGSRNYSLTAAAKEFNRTE